MTNKLIPVEFNDQRILTTEQLAEVYGTEVNNIKNNFNNHKKQFAEGKHYYLLKGEVLRQFKREVNDIDFAIAPNVNQLYLWTERGASRHCKILDTEKAWEQFDNLEDTYFRVKEQPKLCGQMDAAERKAKLDRSEAMRLNALSRLAKPLIEMYKEAEVPPAFKIRALENFYGNDGPKLPAGALTEPEPIMDATAIARKLGIVSTSGIPHAQAVAAIIADLNILDNEKVNVPFVRNGHASTATAYKAPVCEKVRAWLDERNYPTIVYAAAKNYHVRYTEVEA